MRFSPVIYMFTILSKLPQKGCNWCDDCTNTKPNTILNNSQYQETKLKTKPNTIPSNTKEYRTPNTNTMPNQKQDQAIPSNSQYQPNTTSSNTKQYFSGLALLCVQCTSESSECMVWSFSDYLYCSWKMYMTNISNIANIANIKQSLCIICQTSPPSATVCPSATSSFCLTLKEYLPSRQGVVK